ncbi:MAG: helix-turn-helix domain-containing protein [Pseudomonadales bacterium]|jgi:DNA-binding NtrC family response regulator|tara:strand:+ start:259 stop:498 length:240 start_codon:yes stop_codon:yes gene_type:complete
MPVLNLKYIREGAERTAIAKALAISKGKVTAAAKLLGVTRPTLYDLFRRYGIKNDHKVVPLTQLVSHQISGWSEIDQSL